MKKNKIIVIGDIHSPDQELKIKDLKKSTNTSLKGDVFDNKPLSLQKEKNSISKEMKAVCDLLKQFPKINLKG